MKNIRDYILESISPKKVSLIAVGDILAHNMIVHAAEKGGTYNFESMFSDLKKAVSKYDLKFCNQESPIIGEKPKDEKEDKHRVNNKTAVMFNSPNELGDAVMDAGFNLISLANNHVLDAGKKGLEYSREYWSKQNVICSGQNEDDTKDRVKLFEMNGIRFAFVAYTTRVNLIKPTDKQPEHVNVYSNEIAKKDIEYAKLNSDVIIVSIHWGQEYQLDSIAQEQKDISRYLSRLGVNIIIGHHPHVVQPIRWIGNTLCIYSLGNCLACQKNDITIKRIGGMISFDIEFGKTVNIKNINRSLNYIYYNDDHEDFKIIPFSKLTDKELMNYKVIEKDYMNRFHIL